MSENTPLIHSFNNGEISQAALNRVDLRKTALACQLQQNIFPYAIGKAIMRPGTEYLAAGLYQRSRLLPFAKTISARGVLDLTYNNSSAGKLRALIDDELVTRPSVSSTITNGGFSSSSGWTTNNTGGGAANFTNALQLQAPYRGGRAAAYQSVSTSNPDVQHALKIIIARGSVRFRCGSSQGEDDYISETTLDVGTHSLAFTPSGSTYVVEFFTKSTSVVEVTSIAVEAAGIMEVDAPWSPSELNKIRYDQSLDVTFLTRGGSKPQKIERRGNNSWSVVEYYSDDGPFTIARTANLTLTPGATYGNTTLTASEEFFESSHRGALFRLTHEGTQQTAGLAAEGEATDVIRVVGLSDDDEREFTVTVSGTWSGTIRVQRSFDSEVSGFKDYGDAITANVTNKTYSDDDDNAIIYYRVIFKSYTSGSAIVTVTYDGDGGSGICRVLSINSKTSANIEILTDFRSVVATKDWLEGEWSDRRGYPTAVAFFDGRIFFARDDRFWGSVSGNYYSFSLDVEGDSASIQRDVATGGSLAEVHWLLSLQRLLFGTAGAEISARTSAFDEPLTATNLTMKPASTQGVADITPIRVDARGIFVQRGGTELYELLYDIEASDYRASSLMRQHEDLGKSDYPSTYADGITELSVQRQPETYVWGVRNDGLAIGMIYEPAEEVAGWFRLVTGREGSVSSIGDRILSMCVLPSSGEDLVYLFVERNKTVSGVTSKVYCIEKMGVHTAAETRYGGDVFQNSLYMADSYITATADGTSNQTISGLGHLAGNTVIVIGQKSGKTYYSPSTSTFTVNSSGQITLDEAFESGTTIVIGRPYSGKYLGSKVAFGGEDGTALGQKKKISGISLKLLRTHYDAIRFGRSFEDETEMDELPRIKEDGSEVDTDAPFDLSIDQTPYAFPGDWEADPRFAILIRPGYSCQLSAVSVDIETNPK